MPVGNQWKAKAKEEAAAKAAAAAAPVEPPPAATSTGDQGKKVGGARFRSKGAADAKQSETPPAATDKDATGSADADTNQAARSNKSVSAGKWTASQDEQKVIRKKRLEVTESAPDDGNSSQLIADPANVGIILENEPIRLEGVVRADDPSEFQKPLELEKGWAKNLASRFQQQQQNNDSDERRTFKLDVEIGAEAEVHENEPAVLEGVVRSTDRTEDVIGKRGTIKHIAGRFASGQVAADGDHNGENSSASRERTMAPRRSVLERFERGPIDSDGSVVLAENVPEPLDPNVVRSTDGYRANDPVMKAGRTKNMADRFRSQKPIGDDDDEGSGDERPAKPSKPAWLVELEKAKEAETRVVENEPEVRDDVVRADDDTPDIISVQHTRSLRQMWNQIERDKEAAERQPKNRPLPPVAKPKEPSPEPEPPKPPPEEPKPTGRFAARRTVGRLQFGQLQKEEPPAAVVADPGPVGRGKQPAAVGVAGKQPGRMQQQQQQQPAAVPQQPLEVETKASKFNVRPNLKSVNPIRK